MPATDSLVALMRKWPLNSITLFVTTHSRLRRAADGTGTQVATCMINKWMAKINEEEIYNIRGPPRMKDKKKEIEERRLLFLPLWKASVTKHQRTKKKNQSLDQARGQTITPPPTCLIITSIYDYVRLLKLSLKPNSWAHSLPDLLYWARGIWAYSHNNRSA